MTDTITLVGAVATPPKSMQTSSGLSIVSFRLASSQRRYDRTKNAWVDADTNWYTVTAFRQLADHAFESLSKGDRVIVSGRLRVRAWENGERSGTAVEVDADALGPDLLFGTTTFSRGAGHSAETRAPDPERLADGVGPASSVDLDPARPLGDEPSIAHERELVGVASPTPSGWHQTDSEAPF